MKSSPVEYRSAGKNKARKLVLDKASERKDGYFTFFGDGTDFFMAIERKLRVRAIDFGVSTKHRALLKRNQRKWIPDGFMYTSFASYIKRKAQGETFGTIFLDLCGFWADTMRTILCQSVLIMKDDCDIYLTIMQSREQDMRGRTREEYNADRDKEIVAILKKCGVTATFPDEHFKYRNDNFHAPWMQVIHIHCQRL